MSPPPPRSDVTLYYDALSASTLRVLTALHEKKIDFEKKIIDPSKEEQFQPWFQEISRGTGRLPVLRHKEGGRPVVLSGMRWPFRPKPKMRSDIVVAERGKQRGIDRTTDEYDVCRLTEGSPYRRQCNGHRGPRQREPRSTRNSMPAWRTGWHFKRHFFAQKMPQHHFLKGTPV